MLVTLPSGQVTRLVSAALAAVAKAMEAMASLKTMMMDLKIPGDLKGEEGRLR